jgi:hypothetical protein
VGTGNTNDYYPYFVAGWRPENLHYNEGVWIMLKKLAEILHGWNDSLVGSQKGKAQK